MIRPLSTEAVFSHYYAIDTVGNEEVQKSVTFKIDATPPAPPLRRG
jgi:hypothetical protein